MIALSGINKGKILFDESSNPVLQAKRSRTRRVLLLEGIFFMFILLLIMWLIITNFSYNIVSLIWDIIAIIVALVLIIAIILGYFSITFIKVYEFGIALPEKSFRNIFNDEEFVPYSKIKMIKIEQRMLIVKKN